MDEVAWPGIRAESERSDGEGEATKFVEVKLKESSEQRKPAAEHHPGIEIRLNNGRSLLVEPGFDASHLRALLAVLGPSA
jgi:hypothetical protein